MDYGNTKLISIRLYPRRRNAAAQVAEELKTVTHATPSHGGTQKERMCDPPSQTGLQGREITGENIAMGHFTDLVFLTFSHCRMSILSYFHCSEPTLTYKWLQKHILNGKKSTLTKAVSILSGRFSGNGRSSTTLLYKSGPNFTLAFCTVLKLVSSERSLFAHCVCVRSSAWPDRHVVTLCESGSQNNQAV